MRVHQSFVVTSTGRDAETIILDVGDSSVAVDEGILEEQDIEDNWNLHGLTALAETKG